MDKKWNIWPWHIPSPRICPWLVPELDCFWDYLSSSFLGRILAIWLDKWKLQAYDPDLFISLIFGLFFLNSRNVFFGHLIAGVIALLLDYLCNPKFDLNYMPPWLAAPLCPGLSMGLQVCCSVLRFVAVCCRAHVSWSLYGFAGVLQCVAVCCSVLQSPCVLVSLWVYRCVALCCSVLQCVAVCCSAHVSWCLYRCAVYCSVLQYVTLCYIVL